MKIYVCTDIWQFDSGDCGDSVKAFSTIDKAYKWLKQAIKDANTDMKGLDTQHTEYREGDMAYSIWETDNYCYNHIDLCIQELEVE